MSATDLTPAAGLDLAAAAEPPDDTPETTAPDDAPEATAAEATEAVPGTDEKRAATRRRIVVGLASAVVVALAVAAGVLGWKWHQAAALAQDRKAASTAARTAVADVLSYDYRTLDADLARGQRGLAPGFRQEYARVVATSVRPVAVKQQVVTTATVPAVSVVSATRGSVEVLMFVDQLTTSTEAKNVVNVSRVQVTMVRSGDRWLVSELRAI
jgi:Mce-associated membrane protein